MALNRVELMQNAQAHRGPDDRGTWSAELAGSRVYLGHLRLSIIDLSPAGHQPMLSRDQRICVSFNGEIYNYRELRNELVRGNHYDFVSESDTEVILAAYMVWGTRCFERFNGMWAIAIVDCVAGRLVLSRDRFGEKPLYYCQSGTCLLFASEIKALLASSRSKYQVNLKVIGRYLGQSLLSAQDETFFEGITMLPAGTFVSLPLDLAGMAQVKPEKYWQPRQLALSKTELANLPETIWELLLDSVRLRLRSDVPVGLLLSGGLDSSTLAAAMKSVLGNTGTLNLISAVSSDSRYSETPHIKNVAGFLGEQVHTVNLDEHGVGTFRDLELAIYSNDQPVGSFSTVAHLRLMKFCQELGVKVVLSGQGADEIACGYRKYAAFYVQEMLLGGHLWNAGRFLGAAIANKSSIVAQFNLADAKRYMRLPGFNDSNSVLGPVLKNHRHELLDIRLGQGGLRARQFDDIYRFSVPALTHYEDRMSMAFAREIRLPFLDHRVVELFLSIPSEYLLRDGWSKWALRMALKGKLPKEIIWRRDKQGFLNPERSWLATTLRPDIEGMLAKPMLSARLGLINQAALRNLYQRYASKPQGHAMISEKEVLYPLCLELWLLRFQEHLNLS